MKRNYFVIPSLAVLTAVLGSLFTTSGMDWYNNVLRVPSWTPPGSTIGLVWSTIFALTAFSALLVWNKKWPDLQMNDHLSRSLRLKNIVTLFILNAILNVGWSFTFFSLHSLCSAIMVAGALGLSVLALIIYIWPVSKTASVLLFPYLAWVSFATYLTYQVYLLN